LGVLKTYEGAQTIKERRAQKRQTTFLPKISFEEFDACMKFYHQTQNWMNSLLF